MAECIKVLVVDDSALMRKYVTRIFKDCSDIKVVGTAINGHFALLKLKRLNPDIIILDLEMPQMNGIQFLQQRSSLNINIPVIILSSHAKKGASITMDALTLGASDFVLKPVNNIADEIEGVKNALINLVYVYAKPGKQVVTNEISDKYDDFAKTKTVAAINELDDFSADKYLAQKNEVSHVKIIAIGISTGGPAALRKIIPAIPAEFPCPILIVQHMPPGFTNEFANCLNRISPQDVKEAEDGDIIKPGRILVAPGDKHMLVETREMAKVVQLSDDGLYSGHKPSVDLLYKSVAENYLNQAMAIIMTGMGKDGALHIGDIYRNGGITISQDKESSTVFGMPRKAIESGVIQYVVPLDRISQMMLEFVNKRENSN